MTSILYHSNQEVKSSASGRGVTRLDDYHIRLVCCSAVVMTRNPWLMGFWLGPTHSKCTIFGNKYHVFYAHVHMKFYCLGTVTKPSHMLLSLMGSCFI